MRLLDDDPWRHLDDERDGDHGLAPPWLHPECVDACTALTFGTCCRQPGSLQARQLAEATTALEQAAAWARHEAGDEVPGTRLMRRLAPAGQLLGEIPDCPRSASETELFQLSCLAGRIAGCLEELHRLQEPSADPAVCRRRTGLDQVTTLAAERSQRLWDLAVRRLRGSDLLA
jgi:hypothetical protein